MPAAWSAGCATKASIECLSGRQRSGTAVCRGSVERSGYGIPSRSPSRADRQRLRRHEFASAIARLARIGDIAVDDARDAFAAFDIWTSRETERAEMTTSDVKAAATFIRRLELTLRAPEAIHVTIAQRRGAELFTFDKRMAAAARVLGTKVIAR